MDWIIIESGYQIVDSNCNVDDDTVDSRIIMSNINNNMDNNRKWI